MLKEKTYHRHRYTLFSLTEFFDMVYYMMHEIERTSPYKLLWRVIFD